MVPKRINLVSNRARFKLVTVFRLIIKKMSLTFTIFYTSFENDIKLYQLVYYCKFRNFCENFIFMNSVKRHLYVKNSRQ